MPLPLFDRLVRSLTVVATLTANPWALAGSGGDGKYGSFSPSIAAPALDGDPTRDPIGALKRVFEDNSSALEGCAGALSGKTLVAHAQGGGTISVLFELDETGRVTDATRVVQPAAANQAANDCLLRTVKDFLFPAARWPRTLGLVVVVDVECHSVPVGTDLVDVRCKGRYRGLYGKS